MTIELENLDKHSYPAQFLCIAYWGMVASNAYSLQRRFSTPMAVDGKDPMSLTFLLGNRLRLLVTRVHTHNALTTEYKDEGWSAETLQYVTEIATRVASSIEKAFGTVGGDEMAMRKLRLWSYEVLAVCSLHDDEETLAKVKEFVDSIEHAGKTSE